WQERRWARESPCCWRPDRDARRATRSRGGSTRRPARLVKERGRCARRREGRSRKSKRHGTPGGRKPDPAARLLDETQNAVARYKVRPDTSYSNCALLSPLTYSLRSIRSCSMPPAIPTCFEKYQ